MNLLIASSARVLGLALLAAPAAAGAIETDVSLGASLAGSDHATTVAFVDLSGATRQGRFVSWQPVGTLGFVRGREGQRGLERDVAIVAGGVRLVDWWRGAWFSVELARANHTTAALSSHGQFLTSFGWRGERLTLSVRHVSNADLGGGKNLGETMLLAGVHF